jgi:DNA-binding PadR family transcriptional regulator
MVMPLRERLGLRGHQPLSPALEDRLCHLAVVTTSYRAAAEAARRNGMDADDSLIQGLVQRAGKRAEAQAERRVAAAFDVRENRKAVQEAARALAGEPPFTMVLMLDGTMLRSRGGDWGMKPPERPGERVLWHELKAGLVIRLPVAGNGRRRELAKYYAVSDGGPEEMGRRLYAEALRRGLEQAQRVYVIADGAVWIWRVAEEHFPGHTGELDLYHAREHLWALGRALYPDEEEARQWALPLARNLKRQGGGGLLSLLEGLLKTAARRWNAEQCQVLRREAAYFRSHASRMDYPGAKRRGLPLGSGSMESACAQLQGRFKRTGQFWSRAGERCLMALEIAWRNRDWSELWAPAA